VAASVANDGESALRVVAENKPHIVILDVMMPGLKGLDVLRRIKEIDSAIQVILLTGQGATRDGIDGMRFGAFDYMMKPINIDALIEKMDEAINPKKECRQGAGS
jgi:DNA-binding response OmpR family regulator